MVFAFRFCFCFLFFVFCFIFLFFLFLFLFLFLFVCFFRSVDFLRLRFHHLKTIHAIASKVERNFFFSMVPVVKEPFFENRVSFEK